MKSRHLLRKRHSIGKLIRGFHVEWRRNCCLARVPFSACKQGFSNIYKSFLTCGVDTWEYESNLQDICYLRNIKGYLRNSYFCKDKMEIT